MTSSPTHNIFEKIPQAIPDELFEILLEGNNIRIERIVSKGHKSSPDFWYDQDQPEWVLLLKGQARIQFEDHMLTLKAGDYIDIPAHQKHRVDWTHPDEETIWLAIFYQQPINLT